MNKVAFTKHQLALLRLSAPQLSQSVRQRNKYLFLLQYRQLFVSQKSHLTSRLLASLALSSVVIGSLLFLFVQLQAAQSRAELQNVQNDLQNLDIQDEQFL